MGLSDLLLDFDKLGRSHFSSDQLLDQLELLFLCSLLFNYLGLEFASFKVKVQSLLLDFGQVGLEILDFGGRVHGQGPGCQEQGY